MVVRTRTQKEEDECAWREAILEEESQGYVEVRKATPLDPEAMVSVPFVLRPTLVIPKPGQPNKRRFIVNLSWELAERGLREPVSTGQATIHRRPVLGVRASGARAKRTVGPELVHISGILLRGRMDVLQYGRRSNCHRFGGGETRRPGPLRILQGHERLVLPVAVGYG